MSEEKSADGHVFSTLDERDPVPVFRSDIFSAVVGAYARMTDEEFISNVEECFEHCGPPRDEKGHCIPVMDLDSHEVAMHNVIIPQMIERMKKLMKK